ncbi:hypothetical protein CH294_14935 [Rhodococcus sp. 14-2483-1-1]|uniref:DUF3558 domain-containing protein n=1 Tax=Rhodococcus sp. 14-2483-1-1 TaxID=2023148 RepID=UPI000B9A57C7|nr:DUF3558 domain-containing protein [Rhodococcus sp. 14-2483-1-1]OZF35831.1 hypothetical protein CH294_14935 [Rhodococcus sp. 14-2483-1-1]
MRWWVTGVVGVMVLVAGCGDSTSGAPVADSPTSVVAAPVSSEPWDPCTIPNNAIEAAGLDVGSKEPDLRGGNSVASDWKVCSWKNPEPGSWFYVGVFSSSHDLEYLKQNTRFRGFEDEVDGGVEFRRSGQDAEVNCGIAHEVDGGIVYFILDGRGSRAPLGDPCTEVAQVAEALNGFLPPNAN